MSETDNASKKILIVDDSFVNRSYLNILLTTRKYAVSEAGGGKEALDAIDASLPDLILLDLMMPDMDGYETMDALKAKGINVPIIIISADSEDNTRDLCMEKGALCIINKPFKAIEIEKAIKTALHLE